MKQMKMMQQMHPCTLQRASKGFQGLKDGAALQIHPCTPARGLQPLKRACRLLDDDAALKPGASIFKGLADAAGAYIYKHGAHTLYTL